MVGSESSELRSVPARARFTILAQLEWCRAEGVTHAIFTHRGSQIVGDDERRSEARVAALARGNGVEARVAHDGMTRVLRP